MLIRYYLKVSTIRPETAGCKLDKLYDLHYSDNSTLVAAIFWMFGIVLKLIPSLVLSVLLISLVRFVYFKIGLFNSGFSEGHWNVSRRDDRLASLRASRRWVMVVIFWLFRHPVTQESLEQLTPSEPRSY